MSDVAIRVESLGKQYRLGERERYLALRDVLSRGLAAPWRALRGGRARGREPRTIWALKDVSFEVKQGEVVGIIGRNGAGKSTLLKILSRITEPTTGSAELAGRVGSLLEVGTGFHPELTGRENIYLNGAILGMKRAEIQRKFDEIVAFAEVERFVDTPVKHYSSGMYMRLAFSVAAHLEPEILVVDEVLAVGDYDFQKRCLTRITELTKSGRTALLVSHNLGTITALCNSALLLESGQVCHHGEPATVINTYLSTVSLKERHLQLHLRRNTPNHTKPTFTNAFILDTNNMERTTFQYGETLTVAFQVEKYNYFGPIIYVVWIHTSTGIPVLHLASHDDPTFRNPDMTRNLSIFCTVPKCLLYPGTYHISLWMGVNHHDELDFAQNIMQLTIDQGKLASRGFRMTWNHGIFHCETRWSTDTSNRPPEPTTLFNKYEITSAQSTPSALE